MAKVVRLLFVIALWCFVNEYGIYHACRCCRRDHICREELKSHINSSLGQIFNSEKILANDGNIESLLDDYLNMYREMVDDIFLPAAALDLMTYRELLRRYGIVDALKNVFQDDKQITWYPALGTMEGDEIYNGFYLKKTNNEGEYEVCLFVGDTYSIEKNKVDNIIINDNSGYNEFDNNLNGNNIEDIEQSPIGMKSFGGFYVNDKLFEGLRCDGECNAQKNCVSCLLNSLLLDLSLCNKEYESHADIVNEEDGFVGLFRKQGMLSDLSLGIKKFVLDHTKYQWPCKINSQLNIKEIKSHELTERVRQCIMIEWALTVELLKLLSPIIYGNQYTTNTILYRTIKTDHLKKEYKRRRDLFESTSLVGPVYTNFGSLPGIFNSSYIKFNTVPLYRCLFNYIISPGPISMFGIQYDPEQEIGCITRDLAFKQLFNSQEDKNKFKHSSEVFSNGGELHIDHYYKGKDLEKNGRISWNRRDFLIDQFMQQLKKNIEKLNIKGIKKIVFHQTDFYRYGPHKMKQCVNRNGLVHYGLFCMLNDQHVVDIDCEND